MGLQVAAVANSIAGLSVSGVTLFDIDEVPKAADTRKPSIVPFLPNFLTDFTVTRQSQGAGSALQDVRYNLNYRLFYAPVGSGRGLHGVVDVMLDKWALFADALLAIETIAGAVTADPVGTPNFGTVEDPSNKQFWGCDFQIEILEFVN
jgi:hypothetical protein